MIVDSWDKYIDYFSADKKDVYFKEAYCKLYNSISKKAKAYIYQEGQSIWLFPFLAEEIPSQKKYFDFETPYGYGGPITNSNNALFNEYAFSNFLNEMKGNNFIAGFVRFHPIIGNVDLLERLIPVFHNRDTISVDLSLNEDDIWNKEIHAKNRNVIRKAKNNGLIFLADYEFKYLKDFIRLYSKTMQKVNADDFYRFSDNYFLDLKNSLANNSFLATAWIDDNLISAAIIMYDDIFSHYHLSGSDINYFHQSPNNFMLWETILELKRKGINTFHLGGGRSNNPNDKLFDFKKKFSPHLNKFFVGNIIFNHEKYTKIKQDWMYNYPQLREKYEHYFLCYRVEK